MTVWHERPALAVLDLEATGVDPADARIVEVALYLVDRDGRPDPLVDTLIDPGVPMPDGAAEVTGITTAQLEAEGDAPAEILAVTVDHVWQLTDAGVPLVIYNATYDWPLLATDAARHGITRGLPDVPPAVLVDPLVLDRQLDRYRKGSRTLAATCAHYGVELDGAHRAAADALASVRLARKLVEAHPGKLDVDDRVLAALQVDAHRQWRDSFNRYLDRIGADRDRVTGDWPGLERSGPAVALDRCRGADRGGVCSAPIRWVIHPDTGKRAPIDPDPTPDGILKIVDTDDDPPRVAVLGPLEAEIARTEGVPLYLPHHATCPDVERFRR